MHDYKYRHNKNYPDQELRHVDDTYILDTASGLYKPKSHDTEEHREENPTQLVYESPIHVRADREWISIIISVATLVIIAVYTSVTSGIYDTSQASTAATIQASVAARDSADAAKKSADAARTTLTTIQRPFIVYGLQAEVLSRIVPASWDNPTGIDWVFRIPIRNTGITPTSQLFDHTSSWYSGIGPMRKGFDFRDVGDMEKFNVVLAPGDFVLSSAIPVTAVRLNTVKHRLDTRDYEHGAHLYFYGWARYRDLLPDTSEHITKFCFELNGFDHDPYQPSTIPVAARLNVCHAHNCMDDGCKDEK
jgi:hypothetical protein